MTTSLELEQHILSQQDKALLYVRLPEVSSAGVYFGVQGKINALLQDSDAFKDAQLSYVNNAEKDEDEQQVHDHAVVVTLQNEGAERDELMQRLDELEAFLTKNAPAIEQAAHAEEAKAQKEAEKAREPKDTWLRRMENQIAGVAARRDADGNQWTR